MLELLRKQVLTVRALKVQTVELGLAKKIVHRIMKVLTVVVIIELVMLLTVEGVLVLIVVMMLSQEMLAQVIQHRVRQKQQLAEMLLAIKQKI